jgi:hypothetical protein
MTVSLPTPSSKLTRGWAGVIAIVAWLTLALEVFVITRQVIARGGDFFAGFWIYVGYFTILTNTLTAIVMTAVAMGRVSPKRGATSTSLVTAVTLYILIVSVVYTLLLRNQLHFTGLEVVTDIGMHYAVPILTVMWWVVAWPKAILPLRHAAFWLAYPLTYCIYILIRGAWTGWFPYPFVEATTLGWGQVAINCVALTGAFYALGLGAVWLTRVAHWASRSPAVAKVAVQTQDHPGQARG